METEVKIIKLEFGKEYDSNLYPTSGLFYVQFNDEFQDAIYFVNKSKFTVSYICPPYELNITKDEEQEVKKSYENDFILELTKILTREKESK